MTQLLTKMISKNDKNKNNKNNKIKKIYKISEHEFYSSSFVGQTNVLFCVFLNLIDWETVLQHPIVWYMVGMLITFQKQGIPNIICEIHTRVLNLEM